MVYGFVTALVLAGGFFSLTLGTQGPSSTQDKTNIQPVEPLGEYAFRLTDSSGSPVQHSDFLGRVRLVFFGFTHCPNICPLGLTKIADVLERLGEDRSKVAPLFITVDPQRDTPEVMKAFLENFPQDVIGLTGSQDEISALVHSYKTHAEKGPMDSSGQYMVSHSSFIYIMDTNGVYKTHVMLDADAEDIAAQIRQQFS
jgi:protein SCO1/2